MWSVLENRPWGNLCVGSNPTPSAKSIIYEEVPSRTCREGRVRKQPHQPQKEPHWGFVWLRRNDAVVRW